MKRKAEAERKYWEDWKLSRFGEGPFDPVTERVITELIDIKKILQGLHHRTMDMVHY